MRFNDRSLEFVSPKICQQKVRKEERAEKRIESERENQERKRKDGEERKRREIVTKPNKYLKVNRRIMREITFQ